MALQSRLGKEMKNLESFQEIQKTVIAIEHVYCALNTLCHFNIYSSGRTVLPFPIYRRKKLRLKEVKRFVQALATSQWQSWNLTQSPCFQLLCSIGSTAIFAPVHFLSCSPWRRKGWEFSEFLLGTPLFPFDPFLAELCFMDQVSGQD